MMRKLENQNFYSVVASAHHLPRVFPGTKMFEFIRHLYFYPFIKDRLYVKALITCPFCHKRTSEENSDGAELTNQYENSIAPSG